MSSGLTSSCLEGANLMAAYYATMVHLFLQKPSICACVIIAILTSRFVITIVLVFTSAQNAAESTKESTTDSGRRQHHRSRQQDERQTRPEEQQQTTNFIVLFEKFPAEMIHMKVAVY
ncbi:Uncharacterized protein Adt_45038 [Abeliophyllum distichum]|uniref:Uncharacterized protein n=1 Tax=Abeliophyllum distichum TaxID=126358 RepID=A0ABD1PE02_9LAMI